MKKLLVFACLVFTACGGQNYTGIVLPVATNAYFNLTMIGQTWQFADNYNHHLSISLSQVPCAFGHCDPNIIVKHYVKDSCYGYWNPHTPAQCAVAKHLDELWFVLAEGYQSGQQWIHDGAWRAIGFNYIDYLGVVHKVQVINQGQAPPYTIVPNVTGVPPYTYYVLRTNDNFTGDPSTDFSPLTSAICCTTPWQTDGEFGSYSSIFAGTITALISWQYEGCVAEHWYYKINVGIVSIVPTTGIGDLGACITMDPNLAMTRTN